MKLQRFDTFLNEASKNDAKYNAAIKKAYLDQLEQVQDDDEAIRLVAQENGISKDEVKEIIKPLVKSPGGSTVADAHKAKIDKQNKNMSKAMRDVMNNENELLLQRFDTFSVNEAEDNYKEKVLAFLDHPWQEDKEIEFVDLLGQNRSNIEKSSSSFIKSYVKRMYDTNINSAFFWQLVSDKFLDDIQALVESKYLAGKKHTHTHTPDSSFGVEPGDKLMGAKQNGKPKETEYEFVRRHADDDVLVRDTETGKLELWAKSPHFAGYHLIINGTDYEFVRSITESAVNEFSLSTAGRSKIAETYFWLRYMGHTDDVVESFVTDIFDIDPDDLDPVLDEFMDDNEMDLGDREEFVKNPPQWFVEWKLDKDKGYKEIQEFLKKHQKANESVLTEKDWKLTLDIHKEWKDLTSVDVKDEEEFARAKSNVVKALRASTDEVREKIGKETASLFREIVGKLKDAETAAKFHKVMHHLYDLADENGIYISAVKESKVNESVIELERDELYGRPLNWASFRPGGQDLKHVVDIASTPKEIVAVDIPEGEYELADSDEDWALLRVSGSTKYFYLVTKEDFETLRPVSEGLTKGAQDFISRKIAKLKGEGKSDKQAAAIAYSYARRAGFRIPKNESEESIDEARSIGKVNIKKLNKIILDEWTKNKEVTEDEITEKLPVEWWDLWEAADDEIRRIIYDQLMNLAHDGKLKENESSDKGDMYKIKVDAQHDPKFLDGEMSVAVGGKKSTLGLSKKVKELKKGDDFLLDGAWYLIELIEKQ